MIMDLITPVTLNLFQGPSLVSGQAFGEAWMLSRQATEGKPVQHDDFVGVAHA